MITVYSKPNCPNCVAAKALLSARGVEYKEIEVYYGGPRDPHTTYIERDQFMQEFPQVRMMPFLLEGTKHIGGFQELRKHLSA